jgi:hypothetical protein
LERTVFAGRGTSPIARGEGAINAMYIGVNLLVDVLYAYLNPKIRYSS